MLEQANEWSVPVFMTLILTLGLFVGMTNGLI